MLQAASYGAGFVNHSYTAPAGQRRASRNLLLGCIENGEVGKEDFQNFADDLQALASAGKLFIQEAFYQQRYPVCEADFEQILSKRAIQRIGQALLEAFAAQHLHSHTVQLGEPARSVMDICNLLHWALERGTPVALKLQRSATDTTDPAQLGVDDGLMLEVLGDLIKILGDLDLHCMALPWLAVLIMRQDDNMALMLTALMVGRSVKNMAANSKLYLEVLKLLKFGAQFSEVALIMAERIRPPWQAAPLSVAETLKSAAVTAEKFLELEATSPRGSGSTALHRKVARKVLEAYAAVRRDVQAAQAEHLHHTEQATPHPQPRHDAFSPIGTSPGWFPSTPAQPAQAPRATTLYSSLTSQRASAPAYPADPYNYTSDPLDASLPSKTTLVYPTSASSGYARGAPSPVRTSRPASAAPAAAAARPFADKPSYLSSLPTGGSARGFSAGSTQAPAGYTSILQSSGGTAWPHSSLLDGVKISTGYLGAAGGGYNPERYQEGMAAAAAAGPVAAPAYRSSRTDAGWNSTAAAPPSLALSQGVTLHMATSPGANPAQLYSQSTGQLNPHAAQLLADILGPTTAATALLRSSQGSSRAAASTAAPHSQAQPYPTAGGGADMRMDREQHPGAAAAAAAKLRIQLGNTFSNSTPAPVPESQPGGSRAADGADAPEAWTGRGAGSSPTLAISPGGRGSSDAALIAKYQQHTPMMMSPTMSPGKPPRSPVPDSPRSATSEQDPSYQGRQGSAIDLGSHAILTPRETTSEDGGASTDQEVLPQGPASPRPPAQAPAPVHEAGPRSSGHVSISMRSKALGLPQATSAGTPTSTAPGSPGTFEQAPPQSRASPSGRPAASTITSLADLYAPRGSERSSPSAPSSPMATLGRMLPEMHSSPRGTDSAGSPRLSTSGASQHAQHSSTQAGEGFRAVMDAKLAAVAARAEQLLTGGLLSPPATSPVGPAAHRTAHTYQLEASSPPLPTSHSEPGGSRPYSGHKYQLEAASPPPAAYGEPGGSRPYSAGSGGSSAAGSPVAAAPNPMQTRHGSASTALPASPAGRTDWQAYQHTHASPTSIPNERGYASVSTSPYHQEAPSQSASPYQREPPFQDSPPYHQNPAPPSGSPYHREPASPSAPPYPRESASPTPSPYPRETASPPPSPTPYPRTSASPSPSSQHREPASAPPSAYISYHNDTSSTSSSPHSSYGRPSSRTADQAATTPSHSRSSRASPSPARPSSRSLTSSSMDVATSSPSHRTALRAGAASPMRPSAGQARDDLGRTSSSILRTPPRRDRDQGFASPSHAGSWDQHRSPSSDTAEWMDMDYPDVVAASGRVQVVELVSEEQPMMTMVDRFEHMPELAAKVLSLEDIFPRWRRVAGDGNCFYRAFVYGLLEALVAHPDPPLLRRLTATLQCLWTELTAARPAALDDPVAARGHDTLTRWLQRMWYSETSSAEAAPLYLEEVKTSLSERATFDSIVKLMRLLTAHELRTRAEHYAPFIAGSDSDRQGLTIDDLCSRFVERMDHDAEQMQIVALLSSIGVCVGILDIAFTETAYIKHPSGNAAPLFWLMHSPGHYDLICPAGAYDVKDCALVDYRP